MIPAKVEEDAATPLLATTASTTANSQLTRLGWKCRLRASMPRNDATDTLIVKTAIPSMINLAVVPLVNAVDTFWVGRMGIALALAGQAAANQGTYERTNQRTNQM